MLILSFNCAYSLEYETSLSQLQIEAPFLPISNSNMSLVRDIHEQVPLKQPYSISEMSGKTIIVTGVSIGLGQEATKHFIRFNAKHVIMAVRSITKGEAAKAGTEVEMKRTDVCEVWELDRVLQLRLSESTRHQSRNTNAPRGLGSECGPCDWRSSRFWRTARVPSHSKRCQHYYACSASATDTTLLLRLQWDLVPVITTVNSGVHAYTKSPERNTPKSFATLHDPKTAVRSDR